jgi:hypothetical protein
MSLKKVTQCFQGQKAHWVIVLSGENLPTVAGQRVLLLAAPQQGLSQFTEPIGVLDNHGHFPGTVPVRHSRYRLFTLERRESLRCHRREMSLGNP